MWSGPETATFIKEMVGLGVGVGAALWLLSAWWAACKYGWPWKRDK